MTNGYEQGGLLAHKYTISKSSGEPLDPEARCFVLRVDKDPHALVALAAYAESVHADNPQLARDLRMLIADIHLAKAQRAEAQDGK